jgi:alanyl-tRNA synthetase
MITKPEFKIIADHLRSSAFLIADGVLPSNEGRGYVLRRIMRRAMLQLHKLGVAEASMYKMVDLLIKEMGDFFSELTTAKAVIIETLKNEEEKFRETLIKGLKILDEEINQSGFDSAQEKDTKNAKFSGEIAFKLYDTYGFPLDLTQNILKEKNIEVDIEAFEKAMENQRETARKNWVGSGEENQDKLFFDLKEKFGASQFLGYETLNTKAKVLAIIENSRLINSLSKIDDQRKSYAILLDQTAFYATSGGQKGDDGIFKNQNCVVEISETKKFAENIFIHFIAAIKGEIKVGDSIDAEVNKKNREAKAKNHSATHLLHKALKIVLGNAISQRGSSVNEDYLSFDFNYNKSIDEEKIAQIEHLVNFYIQQNSQIKTEIMDLDKAREIGAEALFGEKYDASVRVLSMGVDENNANWSIELCGGTHAKRCGDIGIFKIISEGSIASGIRRIMAKTSFSAIEFFKEKEQKNLSIIDQLQENLKLKQKEIDKLKKQIAAAKLAEVKSEKIDVENNINLLTSTLEDVEANDIKNLVIETKAKVNFKYSHIIAIFGVKDEKISITISVSENITDKFDAAKIVKDLVLILDGKGGGGKKDFAMGGGVNKNKIPNAIEFLKQISKNYD